MAARNFARCLELVLQYEGTYADDPDDPGGETYKGITRRDHPDWPGWQIIDPQKGRDDFPERLESLGALQSLIEDLYKKLYWSKSGCDRLPGPIDLLVFDTAVNMGPKRAASFLQQAVNRLQGQFLLQEDGIIGDRTLAAVASLNPDKRKEIIAYFLELRERRYQGLARSKPPLRKFLKGWLNRLAHLKRQVEKAALA
ncbi:MAG: glycosyl hydrolase 108 family protein [Thermodesulfobacteriota bacterium]